MEGSNDWASLPWLILERIAGADNLTDPKDFVHIRAVCPKWRDAIRPTAHRLFQPWIMVTESPPEEDYSGRVVFHSVSSDESHLIQLASLQGKRVVGSGAGLLIGIDQGDDLSGVLVNPLTGKSTALPRLPDCFQGGVMTSGFATDQKINGEVEVIVVVWVWAIVPGPTVALWRCGSDDGWATTHDADLERFWALLPRHWNRLVTHGPQVLEGELAAAADNDEKELTNGSGTAFLPGSIAVYLVENEGKVRFLLEMPAGPRVTFALKGMVGDAGMEIVDWADAPELQDKVIFRSGAHGACYVIPASDGGHGLSKNAVYYFDWRQLGEEVGGGGGRTDEAFCVCKVDMVEGVDTIVKQVPNPKCRAWETTAWFVPSFKF